MTPFTPVIVVALIGIIIAIVCEIRRANARQPFVGTPSPCERDAQDGRGDGGEGQGFRTIHNLGDTHVG